jgi:cytochrome-b5 reductase
MWQLMQAIEADKTDKTRVILIYANKTEKDILLREEFDRMVNGDSRFKIIYGVDQKSSIVSNAVSFEGYITKQVLQRYLPGPESGEKLKIFVCGPPAQVEAVSGAKAGWSQGDLKGLLADLGYQTSQV